MKGVGGRRTATRWLSTIDAVLLAVLVVGFSACEAPSPEKIKQLRSELRSRDASVRHEAALELGGFGEAAKAAVPQLGRLLNDENGGVQSSAAYALREIDTPQARSILERHQKKNR